MPPIISLTQFVGTNTRDPAHLLPPGVGVKSVNQRPGMAELVPWRSPQSIRLFPPAVGPIYRYIASNAFQSLSDHWIHIPGHPVNIVSEFDESPDKRIFWTMTGGATPKWANSSLLLSTAPSPAGAAYELSLTRPTTAPTVTLGVDGPSGTQRRLYYVYTFFTSTGWESAPSPPALAPLARPGATLNLTAGAVPSGVGYIGIRWYRTQVTDDGASAPFFFLREYTPATTAGQQDDGRDVSGNEILPTAQATIRLPIPLDATWLTYCWNRFAGCISRSGNEVCFSEPNLIYAWPDGNRYTVQAPRALVVVAGRAIVFTERGVEMFSGTYPDALDQKPLDWPVCSAVNSIASNGDVVVWAAHDGLWMFDGQLRCLTSDCMSRDHWLSIYLSGGGIYGYLFEQQGRIMYMGSYFDGTTFRGFIVDPSSRYGFHDLAVGYQWAYWDASERQLFVLDGNTIKRWDGDTAFMTATFTGGVSRLPEETEASIIETKGTGTVRLRVDGATAYDHASPTGEHRTHDGTSGREYQLEVQTSTSFQGVVVE